MAGIRAAWSTELAPGKGASFFQVVLLRFSFMSDAWLGGREGSVGHSYERGET